MKLVFYSLILNNHQANVADELWELTRHSYCFVELANLQAGIGKETHTTIATGLTYYGLGSRKRLILRLWNWSIRPNAVSFREYKL